MSIEVQLDKLLSEDRLSALVQVVDVLSAAENKYGLLSALKGLIEDEEVVGKILNSVINDQTLSLFSKFNNLVKLADIFSNDETIENLNSILELVGLLNKVGILDPIKGMLADEETLGKVLSTVVNDSTLNLLNNLPNLIKLAETISNEETVSNITEILEIYSKLKKLGIIDTIKGLLDDEETIGKIMSGLVNDFTFNVLAHWGEIMNDLSKLDLTNFKYYTLLVNETGEALKQEKIQEIKHWWDLLGLLKDQEVRVGLGVVIAVLKHIGRYHMKYIPQTNNTNTKQ
jgi:uncharacterized protein YjgD (DUF1641 family)